MLIAVGKIKIDLAFLGAEIALDVAVSFITGGVISFVAKRVSITATRITIRAAHATARAAARIDGPGGMVFDGDIPPNINRMVDEEKLGGGTRLDDTAQRTQTKTTTPNTTVVKGARGRNEAEWTTVDGKATEVNARLREDFGETPRSKGEISAQNQVRTEGGIQGDHAGHMVGHRFTGDQGEKNLFPQNGNFNTSAYKKIENEWGRAIAQGREVQVNVKLKPPRSSRPTEVEVDLPRISAGSDT